ncbi:hypothetical protein ACFWJ4_33490 [Kitasatospora sp. NPDC127067]|uniref:hypothetical protein n=1 Tax=Kitasatospora sp. NPDC127067 TaxID=3347126 RepID=UPI0036691541
MMTHRPAVWQDRGWPVPQILIIVVVLGLQAGLSATQLQSLIGAVVTALVTLGAASTLRRQVI